MPIPSLLPLASQRILIRLVQQDDLSDLFDINSDDLVTRYLPYESWKSLADGEAWLKRMADHAMAGSALQCVIVDRLSSRVIGTCLLFGHDQASARAEIGYVMGRSNWRKGLTLEALSLFIGHAFETLSLRRLEAEVDPDNIASNRLLAKLGFIQEGRLRKRWTVKGNSHDTYIYGLLRDEWLTLQMKSDAARH